MPLNFNRMTTSLKKWLNEAQQQGRLCTYLPFIQSLSLFILACYLTIVSLELIC